MNNSEKKVVVISEGVFTYTLTRRPNSDYVELDVSYGDEGLTIAVEDVKKLIKAFQEIIK